MSESPNTTGVGVLSTSRSAFSSKLWKSGQVGSASDRMGEAVLRFTTGVSVDVADGLGVEGGLGVEDGLGVDEGAVVGVEVGGTGVFVGPVVGVGVREGPVMIIACSGLHSAELFSPAV